MAGHRFLFTLLILPLLIHSHKIWRIDAQFIKLSNNVNIDEIRSQLQKAMSRFPGGRQDASAAIFLWRPSARVADTSNWLNSAPACEADRMRMDLEKIFVAYLDDKLAVETLELPDNGLLYFGENANIGVKGDWQCSKRANAEDSFFQLSDMDEPNFYDPKNWRIFDVLTRNGHPSLKERTSARLDAEMVPGDTDYVIMRNISRVFLDDPIKVAGFELDGTTGEDLYPFNAYNDKFRK